MDEIYGKVLPDIWLKLATQTIAQAGQVSPVTTLRTGSDPQARGQPCSSKQPSLLMTITSETSLTVNKITLSLT